MDLTQIPSDSLGEICQYLVRNDLRTFINAALKNRELAAAIKPCIDLYKNKFVNPSSRFKTIDIRTNVITQNYKFPLSFLKVFPGIDGSWYLIDMPEQYQPMVIYQVLENNIINQYKIVPFTGKYYLNVQSVEGVLYVMDESDGNIYSWIPNKLTKLNQLNLPKNKGYSYSQNYKNIIVYKFFTLMGGNNFTIYFYIYDTKTNTVNTIYYPTTHYTNTIFALTENYILNENVRIDIKTNILTPFNTTWLVTVNQRYNSGYPYQNMLYYENKIVDVTNDTETTTPAVNIVDLYNNIMLVQDRYRGNNPTNFTIRDINTNAQQQSNVPGDAYLHSELYNILIINNQNIQILLP